MPRVVGTLFDELSERFGSIGVQVTQVRDASTYVVVILCSSFFGLPDVVQEVKELLAAADGTPIIHSESLVFSRPNPLVAIFTFLVPSSSACHD